MSIKEQTDALFLQYQEEADEINKIKLRNQIVELNMPLVRSIAARLFSGYNQEEDLYQAGYIGLIRAVERYEPEKGAFSTYASWPIFAEMTSMIREDRNIRIPTAIFQEIIRFQKANEKGVSFEKFDWKIPKKSAIRGLNAIKEASLDSPTLSTEEYDSLHEILQDSSNVDVAEEAMYSSMSKILKDALSLLSNREMKIIYYRFGCNKTLEEVGREFNLSRERIREIEKKALIKLGRSWTSSIRSNKKELLEYFNEISGKNAFTTGTSELFSGLREHTEQTMSVDELEEREM